MQVVPTRTGIRRGLWIAGIAVVGYSILVVVLIGLERRAHRLTWAETFAGRQVVRLDMARAAESSDEETARWGDPTRLRDAASVYAALAEKYRSYADRPWVRVPPDPPMPD